MKKLPGSLLMLSGAAILSLLLAGCGSKEPSQTTATVLPTSSFVTEGGDPVTPDTAGGQVVTADGTYRILSPDGSLYFNLIPTESGALTYNLTHKDGTVWLNDSAIGCSLNRNKYYTDPITDWSFSVKETSYSLLGNQSSVTDSYTEAVFTLDRNGYLYYLEIRLFDDGVAFRYNLPDKGGSSRRLTADNTTFALRTDLSQCWYGVENQDYEPVIESHKPTAASDDRIMPPLTAVVKNGGYIALMESDASDSYGGTGLVALGDCTYQSGFYVTPVTDGKELISAWKLINIAPDLNSLVNNTNIYSLCDDPDSELFGDTDWITPGRSVWSWGVDHASPTVDSMFAYTEAAAKLGFEYNIIDDGWPGWSDYKKNLAAIGEYGDSVGVNELLWGAITSGTSGKNKIDTEAAVDAYFKLLSDCHLDGAKVDFWWSEANANTTALQKYILTQAAKRQMVIDFHGCNKNTGLNRTYPNELTREAVRGIENIGLSDTTDYKTYAKWLTAQLFTRYLCGHADWTPACNSAMEIGSIICIDSPLMVLSTDPEDILNSPAVEFIKSIPTVWDQTVVLSDSKIGKSAVYAKQADGVWFVGGIYAEAKSSPRLNLSEFLTGEGVWFAEIWDDDNGKMVCTVKTVTASDVIELADKKAGGGYAVRLSKLELSQYGGAIGEPITVTAADSSAVVKYTVDGSDPMTSSTALTYTAPIELTDTCRLRIAIVEGDGKGTAVSYAFNRFIPATLEHQEEYGDGIVTVTLTVPEGGRLTYTTDGSEPSEISAVYTQPFTLTESAEIRVLCTYADGSSIVRSFAVKVMKRIDYPMPDLLLTAADPLSASGPNSSMGWGIPHFDEANFNDNPSAPAHKISLGGSTADNGTKFDSGLSCNATSTFVYAVPEGATRFVAVVGIDDCIFDNGMGTEASAHCVISFDGVEAYRTTVFRRGEYALIDVEVPQGAQKITVTFGDGGNGITCDNVSMGDPGWMLG
ncbi:MAG: glycoside hydrolase family 97 catalytic domain-containing protein [Eubacteriales bacterium]